MVVILVYIAYELSIFTVKMTLEFIEHPRFRNIFIVNAPSLKDKIDLGALLSRYSRTHESIKELYKTEFLTNPDRGAEFYKKNFGQYGDESISELVPTGFAICAENVPKMWGGYIFHYRHLSGIEKSSRYMKTLDYYKEGGLIHNQEYINQCNLHMFKFQEMYEITKSKLVKKFGDGTKATEKAIVSATLDACRELLPLSTLTSFGVVANLRSWINILSKETANHNPESLYIQRFINPISELLIENFGAIINSDKLIEEYNKNVLTNTSLINDIKFQIQPNFKFEILDCSPKPVMKFFTELLMINRAKKQKMTRDFENVYFMFNIPHIDIGTFYDFQRHRHLTIQILRTWFRKKQPDEIHRLSSNLGTQMNIIAGGNLREWVHCVELRTQQTGHYKYRYIFQKIGQLIAQEMNVEKELIFPYADWRSSKEIGLGRRESELKKIEKGVDDLND